MGASWFRLVCAGLMLLAANGSMPAARAQMLLDPATQPRFVNPLPLPARIDATSGGSFTVTMAQTQQDLGLVDPVLGIPLLTTVWGYDFGSGPTYPGATIEAYKDMAVDILWQNNLPFAHLLPVDVSLHWAFQDPINGQSLTIADDGVPTVVHLHGGHTESASDGLPESWYTPGFAVRGPHFTRTSDGTPQGTPLPFHYDNDQEAATLWYHDHALGITRLNVYAGLAGFYLLRDANEAALVAANHLPTGPHEVELVIQDRMFTADGELFYPSDPPVPGAPDPSVLPEFFGDTILVNGKAWPVLEVEPRQYRFRMLNGSDSRFYNMWIAAPVEIPFHQIGSDTGLLNAPVEMSQLLIAPGERVDVVVDFSDPALAGETLVLRNNAKSPFPFGAPPNPMTSGQIVAFRVTLPLDTSVYPLTTLPASLRPLPVTPPVQNGATRQLVLFEGVDHFGRLQPLLGTASAGALLWDDPITETPMLDDVEVWEIYNVSGDAHPIHLHLVAFQVVNRQKFSATVDSSTGAISDIRLRNHARPPPPGETGFKDTVQAYPGEVTRIIAKFDRPGRYVWHCHILSHEDHEMMRPYMVMTP